MVDHWGSTGFGSLTDEGMASDERRDASTASATTLAEFARSGGGAMAGAQLQPTPDGPQASLLRASRAGPHDGEFPLFDPYPTGPVAISVTTGKPVGLAFQKQTFSDPELQKQWHLGMLGNIGKVWADYTGDGVSVGVFDSGVQYAHWDLAPNYDATKHVVVDGKTYDGNYTPTTIGREHGTSVAGVIAAARNGDGGVGVAYGASLTGVNIFDPGLAPHTQEGIYVNGYDDRARFFEALAQSATFDVANHSWGDNAGYRTASNRLTEGSYTYGIAQSLDYAARNGRHGLGTIQVGAAGNTPVDGQGDGMKTDRHMIAVSAYREVDGSAAFYSTHGAHLLVAAPSNDYTEFGGRGVVTTDLLGWEGYNKQGRQGTKLDYNDAFGGTSSATPVISGVAALMLDANDQLGWRDVKNILAASARMPVAFDAGQTNITGTIDGTDLTLRLNSSPYALNGRDAGWNGGRMHYSNDYGYGAVDAYAAVRMAEVWSLFGSAKTSVNEVSVSTGKIDVDLTSIASGKDTPTTRYNTFVGTPEKFTFDVADDIDVEHIDLTIDFKTMLADDSVPEGTPFSSVGLKIRVTAPDGTVGFIDTQNSTIEYVDDSVQTFTFGLSGFRGAQTAGTWTFEFEQVTARVVGVGENGFTDVPDARTTISALKMDLYGAEASTDDVHTYTDEFFTMTAIAGERDERRVLKDVNGGTDWVNMAAVSANVNLSLVAGAATTIGGKRAFTVDTGTQLENAVTGDGDDRIEGNALANELHGMRGNDVLLGRGGNDRLDGGAGDDRLDGGAGRDVLTGGVGRDSFLFDNKGTSGIDTITDFGTADRLVTTAKLRTGSDGLVAIGADGVVYLDGTLSGDRVTLEKLGGKIGLQFDGIEDGQYVYSLDQKNPYYAALKAAEEAAAAPKPPTPKPGAPAPAPSVELPAYAPLPDGPRARDLATGQLVGLAFERRTFTDPEVQKQWHLGLIGDIENVWKDYTGKGVSVGVYGSGIQYDHWDLNDNIDRSKHIVVDGKTYDGDYRPWSGPIDGTHETRPLGKEVSSGTASAGLIAAERNGRGGVGVAYNSKLTGVNVFDQYSEDGSQPGISLKDNLVRPDGDPQEYTDPIRLAKFYSALADGKGFDIVNHSWGVLNFGYESYYDRYIFNDRGTDVTYYFFDFAKKVADALAVTANEGRSGLGTIQVTGAGNFFDINTNIYGRTDGVYGLDGQAEAWKSDRHLISVGAFREADGSAVRFGAHGAQILVSAPSADGVEVGGRGLVTTDLLGIEGANHAANLLANADYTDYNGELSIDPYQLGQYYFITDDLHSYHLSQIGYVYNAATTTSASAIVTGVTSLMLDANENLGWRDVKDILAASARMPVAFETGQTFVPGYKAWEGEPILLNNTKYKLGGTDANWNGGRMHFSNDYGYGAVDAHAAVRMAEVWSLFGAPKTSANEQTLDTGQLQVGLTSVASGKNTLATSYNSFVGTPQSYKFTISKDMQLDHIDLTVGLNRQYTDEDGVVQNYNISISDVKIRLIAPDGTSSFVDTSGDMLNGYHFSDEFIAQYGPLPQVHFTFGLEDFRGAQTVGDWTFEFEQILPVRAKIPGSTTPQPTAAQTTVNSIELRMFGDAASADDVHTYTDEFFTMTKIAGEAAERRTLEDLNGGTDWINAAAVTSDVKLSLVAGQSTSFGGGKAFTIGRTSNIENAVTGDGNDTLIGNRFDNKLFGMRGNDTLNGGAGNDTLFGGTGNDRFLFDTAGVSGKDTILDWSAGDLIGSSKALRGVGSDGRITVAKNATLLLDGTVDGDTVLLSQNGGAVLQELGKRDGYYWYSYVSGTSIDENGVIREASFQPAQTARGMVQALASTGAPAGDATAAASGATTLAHLNDDHGAFYLYDAMAGSMSNGVLLHA